MAIDITNDKRTAWAALERAKSYCDRIRRKKAVYSVHLGNVIMCSTSKGDIESYISSVTPKGKTVKEVQMVPLQRVNEMRRKMSLGEIIKKLGLDMTTNTLKVALINAGYIKTNKQISEEKAKRDKKILALYDKGYTYAMIREELKLAIKESTIERICKDW